ncbi:serine/threonine protein kinase [Candidatus Magnetomorum sp. HK-1]|nr:serine/threonine protein kinase [Candidatus Magnetomorum sp. HK-1]
MSNTAKIFISYSRKDLHSVDELADDLAFLGHSVWFDQNLQGGQSWWDNILAQIVDSDFFVCILSQWTVQSTACKKELQYAKDLGIAIIPILISEKNLSMNLLPPELSKIQYLDYRNDDRKTILKFAKTFCEKVPAKKVHEKLPPPPSIPISYLGSIAEKLSSSITLSYEVQSSLLIDIKKGFNEPTTEKDAFQLLKNLRKRRDLFATIAEEIDELIASKYSYKNINTSYFDKIKDWFNEDISIFERKKKSKNSKKKSSNKKTSTSTNEVKEHHEVNCELCGKLIIKEQGHNYLNSMIICNSCWVEKKQDVNGVKY